MLQQHFSSFSLSLETLIQPKFSSQICPNSSFQTPSTSPPPSRFPRRLLKTPRKSQNHSPKPNPDLRKLTSRIVDLTRRRQLHQIFREIELSRRRHGKLNTIVMNAVMEACVHCKDVDSAMRIFQEMSEPDGCGVDSITFATLLKGLGEAQRIDEAFQILESVEQGTAVGNPKLSPSLIHGLLNALLEAGDLRRANGLLARCRSAFHGSSPSILMYNLLMKGYANTGIPLDAVAVRDEISRIGLKPDRRTYNTLIHACVKSGKMDSAMQLVAEMKEEAYYCHEFSPDAVTYTTLLMGFGNSKDLLSVQKLVVEMKSSSDLFIDRVAYNAMIDALLNCGSTRDALCIFGDMMKKPSDHLRLQPKPHLYLAMMRAFAFKGDYFMVKRLHLRIFPDCVGAISASGQAEADELLMEAAINNDQVDVARQILKNIIAKRRDISWTSRGGMVAVRIEALSGFNGSMFCPYLLPQVSLGDPIEKYMTPFKEASPLQASLDLKKAVMRFYRDAAVPVVDDWGSCVGIVHREDCNQLNAPLSQMMRGPPPCVTTSTSVGRVIELLLEKSVWDADSTRVTKCSGGSCKMTGASFSPFSPCTCTGDWKSRNHWDKVV
ncbi:hypothetical protein MRB53_008889 [Persea americana]|uniref:Uncharacterized protein n=1 Tax=Persea americana TaxID=3435 RepID=A0ACC2LNG0_PERAE|nr:hypothetical protein MRB53_008889 [Persea americana]